MDLLQHCPLFTIETAREDTAKDIEVSHSGNVPTNLLLLEGKVTFSLELKRLALPPEGSALSLEVVLGGALLSIVLNIL